MGSDAGGLPEVALPVRNGPAPLRRPPFPPRPQPAAGGVVPQDGTETGSSPVVLGRTGRRGDACLHGLPIRELAPVGEAGRPTDRDP